VNEMKPTLPPELHALLDTFYTAPHPSPGFTERLEAQLREQHARLIARAKPSPFILPGNRRSLMQSLRARPILALLAALLGLLLLTGVAYAVGRLLGFIPGIGFVGDVQSILESPVVVNRPLEGVSSPTPSSVNEGSPAPLIASETIYKGTEVTPGKLDSAAPSGEISSQAREGITLAVEQVVSESERLAIAYKITGLPANIYGAERMPTLQAYAETHPDGPMPAQIRLPDGTLLEHAGGGHCSGGGDGVTSWLSCRILFSPLPDGVNEFTLEIQRLQNALPGELPEDWQIPIRLTPVEPNGSGSAGGVQEPNLHSQQVNGITLRLIKAAQTPSETAFQFAMKWEGPNRFLHHTAPFILQDSGGRYYILSGGPDGGSGTIENPNTFTLPSLVTSPIDSSSPLTFRLDWAILSISVASADDPAGAPILRVDVGQTAHPGQEWRIDRTIQAGGFDLRFTQARLKPGQDGSVILEVDAQPQPGVTALNLFPAEGSSTYEAGYDKTRGVLVSRITLPALPGKPLDLYISEILYKVNGPWEITWQPEKISPSAQPAPAPAPTRMAAPFPTLVPNAPVLSDLQTLLKRAGYPAGPGWVHQVWERELAEPVGVLDMGDLPEQPLHTRVDAWYRLDENGYVRTTLYINKTLNGKFLSADIDNGVYHFRLPEGWGGIGQDIYLAKPSYDMNLISTFNGYVSEGGAVHQESAVVSGIACRLFEATRAYDSPQFSWGEPAPVRAVSYSACIDPVNGKIVQIQNKMIYTDGTSRMRDTTRFLTLEQVAVLPEEVNQILEKVIMP